MERQRVIREAKQEDEWEVRARQIEAEEATLHHLQVEEAKRKKEKRMFEDKVKLVMRLVLSSRHRYRHQSHPQPCHTLS